ncbi:hypothetical protein RB195_012345 [Necator americanus]|uniref:Uncharacterized protein n=1 Tax=Necator americanus TaxID=51031 RepID=A0ABR1D6P3_NECAM
MITDPSRSHPRCDAKVANESPLCRQRSAEELLTKTGRAGEVFQRVSPRTLPKSSPTHARRRRTARRCCRLDVRRRFVFDGALDATDRHRTGASCRRRRRRPRRVFGDYFCHVVRDASLVAFVLFSHYSRVCAHAFHFDDRHEFVARPTPELLQIFSRQRVLSGFLR